MRNKKSCAWQYVPPGWFEECDHGVSECQSLYDSDTVKSSKLKNVRRKLNILLLRRHLYTIQCHMTTLWYRSWIFLAVLTDRACRHESDFSQLLEDGSDSTCGRRMHAVQNKRPVGLYSPLLIQIIQYCNKCLHVDASKTGWTPNKKVIKGIHLMQWVCPTYSLTVLSKRPFSLKQEARQPH